EGHAHRPPLLAEAPPPLAGRRRRGARPPRRRRGLGSALRRARRLLRGRGVRAVGAILVIALANGSGRTRGSPLRGQPSPWGGEPLAKRIIESVALAGRSLSCSPFSVALPPAPVA